MATREVRSRLSARSVAPAVVLALLLAAVLGGCAPTGSARFVVGGASALVDEAVDVALTEVPPRAIVTVRATARDRFDTSWSSSARFRASSSGRVSLSDASLGGSWTGREAMGFLLFMRAPGQTVGPFAVPDDGFDVELSAESDGRVIARTALRRDGPAAVGVQVRTLTLDADGVVGTLFVPAAANRHDVGVLAFGGSQGYEARHDAAAALAARGYPALSLAYYAAPGLPKTLRSIPIEYFERALDILAARSGASPDRLVVWGASRGTEAAQLLALQRPEDVSALVLGAPNDHVNVAFPEGVGAAWTIGGRPVPAAPAEDRTVPDPNGERGTTLAIQRYPGRVVTLCGAYDVVWPACEFAESIERRRAGRTGDRYERFGGGHSADGSQGYVPIEEPEDEGGRAQQRLDRRDLPLAVEAHEVLLEVLGGL